MLLFGLQTIRLLLQQRLAQPDATNGVMLDGFPRNVRQAEQLLPQLWPAPHTGTPLKLALHLSLRKDLLLQKICARRGSSHKILP
jgi:adenylate kinase